MKKWQPSLRALVLAATRRRRTRAPAGRRERRPPSETVTISGRAYAFNHMDTYLEGATIRVRENPDLTAVTDANGDYELEVPTTPR